LTRQQNKSQMEKRLNMAEVEPQAYKAMYALVNYLNAGKVSKTHKELIKLRASQINGCAYCIEMHTGESLKIGESVERLLLLDAWRESSKFTKEEKAVLALTEQVTLISKEGVTDSVYNEAVDLFGEQYVAELIMNIVTINAWNRIAIPTQMEFSKA